VRRSERSNTLTGQLRTFFDVPDNVLAIAQNQELLRDLDIAFFKVGEAMGGTLVKYYDEEIESADELRSYFERGGLELRRLEEEGRFRLVAQGTLEGDQIDTLWRLMDEEGFKGRSIWANFNLNEQVDLDAALRQQEQMAQFVEDKALVVKLSVLERAVDEWPDTLLRRAELMRTGTLWLSESGLAFRRVLPSPRS
jgi:hypothetical protein